MKHFFRILFCLFLYSLIPFSQVRAIYDPREVPNNKYGMHVADPNDIPELPPLVNSSGGDWGYVTLVIPDHDRDTGKWQRLFDQMRRSHLIPLVRLATHVSGSAWEKPSPNDINSWVQFLSSLNWPIENKYVILFNEPNHAKEWGNMLDPEGYADIAAQYIDTLKAKDANFFILPAGFDAAAANGGDTMDIGSYMNRIHARNPALFARFDGWNSHSYPNPAFSGSPYDTGKGTIRSFLWELQTLKNFGVTKNFPVFITETGWVHSYGKSYIGGYYSPDQVGTNMAVAAQGAWADERVVAVTPFVFNYQDVPFDHFSWRKLGSHDYYSLYAAYQSIPKTKGFPKQQQHIELVDSLLPPTVLTASTYTFFGVMRNRGQAILSPEDGYQLDITSDTGVFSTVFDSVPHIEPGEEGAFSFHIRTPETPGEYTMHLVLKHYDRTYTVHTQTVMVQPPPSFRITLQKGWKSVSEDTDASVLIYDGDTLLQKFTHQTVKKGEIFLPTIHQIIPGKNYRVVILIPSYLPRQVISTITSPETHLVVKRLLPFDINRDGKFSLSDVGSVFVTRPHDIIGLFFGP